MLPKWPAMLISTIPMMGTKMFAASAGMDILRIFLCMTKGEFYTINSPFIIKKSVNGGRTNL